MKPRDHREEYIPNKRKSKSFIRIYCEGETEVNYFRSIKYELRRENLKVELIKKKQDKLIETVEERITKKDIDLNYDNNDFIWCVIDVEENENIWRNVVNKIKSFQNNKNKFVITSNPSFEVWLLLFFKYSTRNYTNKQLCEELTKKLKIKNYSRQVKGKNIKKHMKYFKNIDKAIKRAKKQIKFHKKENRSLLDYNSNPHTQIYRIFDKINR
jgi:hypothetical protein